MPGDDLNRAMRVRGQMSPLGLAHLWLAGAAARRAGSVDAVLDELRARLVDQDAAEEQSES